MALAECPCLPPLLSLYLFLGPVVGSAGFSWAWDLGPFWGGRPVLRGAGMACPGAASVIAVWLSGALAQQVASRIPSLLEPPACSWTPALSSGAEESSLLEIGRLEGRAGSVGWTPPGRACREAL